MKICIMIENGKKIAFGCDLLPEYYKKYGIREAIPEEKEEYFKNKPLFDKFGKRVILKNTN